MFILDEDINKDKVECVPEHVFLHIFLMIKARNYKRVFLRLFVEQHKGSLRESAPTKFGGSFRWLNG